MLNELVGAIAQVLFLSLLPLAVWYVTARKKESFFSWIGLRKPVCGNMAAALNAFAAAVLYIFAMNISIKVLPEGVTAAGSQFAGMGLKALPAVFFYAFLRTALSEEILFRAFILKCIERKAGFAAGNSVQALLFSL